MRRVALAAGLGTLSAILLGNPTPSEAQIARPTLYFPNKDGHPGGFGESLAERLNITFAVIHNLDHTWPNWEIALQTISTSNGLVYGISVMRPTRPGHRPEHINFFMATCSFQTVNNGICVDRAFTSIIQSINYRPS